MDRSEAGPGGWDGMRWGRIGPGTGILVPLRWQLPCSLTPVHGVPKSQKIKTAGVEHNSTLGGSTWAVGE